jgi:hypothetical protein
MFDLVLSEPRDEGQAAPPHRLEVTDLVERCGLVHCRRTRRLGQASHTKEETGRARTAASGSKGMLYDCARRSWPSADR